MEVKDMVEEELQQEINELLENTDEKINSKFYDIENPKWLDEHKHLENVLLSWLYLVNPVKQELVDNKLILVFDNLLNSNNNLSICAENGIYYINYFQEDQNNIIDIIDQDCGLIYNELTNILSDIVEKELKIYLGYKSPRRTLKPKTLIK